MSNDLGIDRSGNGNNWTTNNLSATDQMLDSPTNNFCTLNPLSNGMGDTLSQGNLKSVHITGADKKYFSTMGMSSGKWYAEIYLKNQGSRNLIGITSTDMNQWDTSITADCFYGNQGNDRTRTEAGETAGSYTGTWSTGDTITIALDLDNGKGWMARNAAPNTAGAAEDSTIDTSLDYVFFCREAGATSTNIWNFGQDSSFAGNKTAQGNTDDNGYGDFYYEPPTGFNALCTQNLPDPDVIPSEHFNTVLYTGNGGTQSITGVGFQPDWLWTKGRQSGSGSWHMLFDVLRGNTKELYSNDASAENTDTNTLTSFDSDGLSVGADNDCNYNGQTYVSWNWKANGSGVSNTDGTITSTVSANTDAGFSIVSYTGTGSNATVGHGLSKAPEMIIAKNKDYGFDWVVYHQGIASDAETDWISLNLTNAASDLNTVWNDTAPTSSVFSVGTNWGNNRSGEGIINYCFHSVDGYSKVGSYTGNGSSDGTFVYTGFRPAYVMIKAISSGTADNWTILDNDRSPYNVSDDVLRANSSASEYSNVSWANTDFCSNGFKIRNVDGYDNGNGTDYIYIAFAEMPFKHTNAR